MVREFGKRTVEEDEGPREEAEEPWSRKRRRRGELSEMEERLESLIHRLGEKSTTTIQSNIAGLAAVLEADLDTYHNRILSILLKCVTAYPQKMGIYATIVGLLNAKEQEFGKSFLERLTGDLKTYLQNGQWDLAYPSVLFICDLVNSGTVSAHSLAGFIACLLDAVMESGSPGVRSDWYCRVVLHGLALSGPHLYRSGCEKELTELCDVAERYLGTRTKDHVPLLRVWSAEMPHKQLDSLDSLWLQIGRVRRGDWSEPGLVRLAAGFDSAFVDALQHNLPPTFTPPSHVPGHSTYPLPSVTFRMFHHTDCPDEGPGLPDHDSIDRFLVEQDLTWVIRQFHLERKVCSDALLDYECHRPVALNYAILEVIFGQLLRLPAPPHLPLFYASLMIELCKRQNSTMPQVLAQTAELFYDRLETIQPAAFDRLVDWFAFHLSNFHFRWSWDDWSEALELEPLAPKRLFVQEVLSKCMRLSYHQYVVDLVPAAFAPVLPAKPAPAFKYGQEDAAALPATATAHQLAQAIRNRASADDILAILKDCPRLEEGQGDAEAYNPLAIQVFTLTLLHLGSKSFSHSFAALAKYHQVLKTLTEGSEAAQGCILSALYEIWSSHPHNMLVLVDKMLKMQIVECVVVVEWLFSAEVREDFLRYWVWEVLESALLKLSRHVSRLREDAGRAEAKWRQRLEAKAAEGKEEKREAAEESGEGVVMEAEETESEPKELVEMREQVEGAESVQRNLLLTLFQKLTILLTEHLVRSESEGTDIDTLWYRWVQGRFRQVFLVQWQEAGRYQENLSSYLFTPDTDPHILQVFNQFCALRK